MPVERKHVHIYKNDLTCRCGEMHPVVVELRQRIEDMEHQEFPSIVIDPVTTAIEVEKAEWNAPNGNGYVLDADLQAIVDEKRQSPQVRAKMARYAFGARGWPNEEHPGTVRDFLEEHGVPIIAENSISTRQEK